MWSDLGVFMGIQQGHLEPSSPLYPASTNYHYSVLHCLGLHGSSELTEQPVQERALTQC
jgi:hypothetical protein